MDKNLINSKNYKLIVTLFKIMKSVFLVILVFLLGSCSNLGVTKESYRCLPIDGAENFKGDTVYRIERIGDDVKLKSSDDFWRYKIFYSSKDLGFRAVRGYSKGKSHFEKISSITIGGTLYLMKNFKNNVAPRALVTYANAFRENDIGKMSLECVEE